MSNILKKIKLLLILLLLFCAGDLTDCMQMRTAILKDLSTPVHSSHVKKIVFSRYTPDHPKTMLLQSFPLRLPFIAHHHIFHMFIALNEKIKTSYNQIILYSLDEMFEMQVFVVRVHV